MSLEPEEMICHLSIGYMQSGRGPLGEHLPEQLVVTGKAWAKRELVSGRRVRTLDQQQVAETCLFTTHLNLNVNINWKITTSDRAYIAHNVERLADCIIIAGKVGARHDRAGIKDST